MALAEGTRVVWTWRGEVGTGYWVNKRNADGRWLIECELGSHYGWDRDSDVPASYMSRGSDTYYWVTAVEPTGEPITKPKKSLMTTINTMMKKLLDGDTQKLLKAGLINGDLEVTEKGKSELITHLFLANKADMVKVAEEIIKEEKE